MKMGITTTNAKEDESKSEAGIEGDGDGGIENVMRVPKKIEFLNFIFGFSKIKNLNRIGIRIREGMNLKVN